MHLVVGAIALALLGFTADCMTTVATFPHAPIRVGVGGTGLEPPLHSPAADEIDTPAFDATTSRQP
jgi:hypothetical protein